MSELEKIEQQITQLETQGFRVRHGMDQHQQAFQRLQQQYTQIIQQVGELVKLRTEKEQELATVAHAVAQNVGVPTPTAEEKLLEGVKFYKPAEPKQEETKNESTAS